MPDNPSSAISFLLGTPDPDPHPDHQAGAPDSFLVEPGATTPASPTPSLATFLASPDVLTTVPPLDTPMYDPPSLDGIHEIVLNFATTGLDWQRGARPIGLTVATLDGEMIRFLPFAFAGGNLDEAQVKRFLEREVRGKHITNANTGFEIHMARVWGVDLEAQGNTFSDIQHTAALLDDHRRQVRLDVLVKDYLPHEEMVARLDEESHREYHAYDVVMRELFTAYVVGQLREVMYPQLDAQNLRKVQTLEDEVIPVVCEMEKNGSPLDLPLLDAMSKVCQKMHSAVMKEVIQEAGFAFDHTDTSWGKLFEKCGLTPQESYAEDIVGPIEHPLIQQAHFADQLASLQSKTFTPYLKMHRNGVLYYDINQLNSEKGGTRSGRFSIGYVHQVPNHDNHHAVFGQGDVEACDQNACMMFPRRMFLPAVGDYLEADASQIEYRLFAHYANNPQVIKAYKDNPWLSFHKQTWEMFKVHIPTMLYTDQKRFNFARQYGAKLIRLGVMMGVISAKEGEEIRKAKRWNDPRLAKVAEIEKIYKQVLPEGDLLLDISSHLAKSKCDSYCKDGDAMHQKYSHQGYVETILGRRSRFPENYKTYIGLNRRLQGSAADIMKQKLVELHKARHETGFLMRLTVHDSVLGDAQTPETPAKVDAILNAQSFETRVPILWSVGHGRSWAGCK